VIVSLTGVEVRRAGRTILGPLDWEVRSGERWVVLGPNGSGKTTLVAVAAMDLWPSRGTVDLLGARYGRVDARERRHLVGIASSAIEGRMRLDLSPRDLIVTARHGALEPWWHEYSEADRSRAAVLGARFGLGDRLDQALGTLSAGERRRVSIARALMSDPDVLILDEPTANLDLAARETLLHDLAGLADEQRPAAAILVSHHVEEIPPTFGHALVLRGGGVVAAGPIGEVMTDAVLSAAFGLPLVVERREGRWSARLG
jgi:iron complex transport system ATP-binding protein